MNLSELKEAVDAAIEKASEYGEDPANIPVSLQIDEEGFSTWASDDLELHYDNNGQASGCVLVAVHGEG